MARDPFFTFEVPEGAPVTWECPGSDVRSTRSASRGVSERQARGTSEAVVRVPQRVRASTAAHGPRARQYQVNPAMTTKWLVAVGSVAVRP